MRTQNFSHHRNSSTCLHNGRPTRAVELCLFGGRGTGADGDFSSQVYVEAHLVLVLRSVYVSLFGYKEQHNTHVYLECMHWPAFFVLKLEHDFGRSSRSELLRQECFFAEESPATGPSLPCVKCCSIY